MTKAILFDIDGVLLDSFEANLKFFQDLMTHFGYPAPTREAYRPMFHFPMREVIAALAHPPQDEIEKIWKAGRSRVVPYPLELLSMPTGSAEVVQALHSNYRLGIVTGRVPESIFELPDMAALKPLFHAVVSNLDTVEHKPHPAPLLLAAQRLGLPPAECIYIGDVDTDLQASQAAGMPFIAYAQAPLTGAQAWTDDFTKIPELISQLS